MSLHPTSAAVPATASEDHILHAQINALHNLLDVNPDIVTYAHGALSLLKRKQQLANDEIQDGHVAPKYFVNARAHQDRELAGFYDVIKATLEEQLALLAIKTS
jgi:hypothetical protein